MGPLPLWPRSVHAKRFTRIQQVCAVPGRPSPRRELPGRPAPFLTACPGLAYLPPFQEPERRADVSHGVDSLHAAALFARLQKNRNRPTRAGSKGSSEVELRVLQTYLKHLPDPISVKVSRQTGAPFTRDLGSALMCSARASILSASVDAFAFSSLYVPEQKFTKVLRCLWGLSLL